MFLSEILQRVFTVNGPEKYLNIGDLKESIHFTLGVTIGVGIWW
jgi:hypothetical protein